MMTHVLMKWFSFLTKHNHCWCVIVSYSSIIEWLWAILKLFDLLDHNIIRLVSNTTICIRGTWVMVLVSGVLLSVSDFSHTPVCTWQIVYSICSYVFSNNCYESFNWVTSNYELFLTWEMANTFLAPTSSLFL